MNCFFSISSCFLMCNLNVDVLELQFLLTVSASATQKKRLATTLSSHSIADFIICKSFLTSLLNHLSIPLKSTVISCALHFEIFFINNRIFSSREESKYVSRLTMQTRKANGLISQPQKFRPRNFVSVKTVPDPINGSPIILISGRNSRISSSKTLTN